MRYQYAALAALAGATALDIPVAAQQPEPAVAVEGQCCRVPARTPVQIEILDAISTQTNRTGQTFAIRLAEPLIVDGRTLAPAGATGLGEIVHAARAGMGGRAGELILAARYVEVGGRQLRLRSLRFRQQGRDSSNGVAIGTSVAGAVFPAASIVGFLIQGGQVRVPAGARAQALTAEDILLPAVPDSPTDQQGDEE